MTWSTVGQIVVLSVLAVIILAVIILAYSFLQSQPKRTGPDRMALRRHQRERIEADIIRAAHDVYPASSDAHSIMRVGFSAGVLWTLDQVEGKTR